MITNDYKSVGQEGGNGMDNRNTLRSQTVQCTHCGEYYSVTYDY